MYDILLSSPDDLSELIDDLNDQWKAISRRVSSDTGYFVNVFAATDKGNFKTAYGDSIAYASSARVIFALNNTASRRRCGASKMTFPHFPNDARVSFVDSFGPLSKEKAETFGNYLDMALRMNTELNSVNKIKEFCSLEYEKYLRMMDHEAPCIKGKDN